MSVLSLQDVLLQRIDKFSVIQTLLYGNIL